MLEINIVLAIKKKLDYGCTNRGFLSPQTWFEVSNLWGEKKISGTLMFSLVGPKL